MKNYLLFIFLTANLSASGIYEAKEIKIGSESYTNAKIQLANKMEAKITHESGIKRIDGMLLPEEVQIAIGYNREDAETALIEHKEKVRAANAERVAEYNKKQADAEKAAKTFRGQYQIEINSEEGLVCYLFAETSVNTVIPGGSSRVGGGGGKAITSKQWTNTGKQVFIPHNEETKNLNNGAIFQADSIIGTPKRLTEIHVVPTHHVESIKIIRTN